MSEATDEIQRTLLRRIGLLESQNEKLRTELEDERLGRRIASEKYKNYKTAYNENMNLKSENESLKKDLERSVARAEGYKVVMLGGSKAIQKLLRKVDILTEALKFYAEVEGKKAIEALAEVDKLDENT